MNTEQSRRTYTSSEIVNIYILQIYPKQTSDFEVSKVVLLLNSSD